MLTQKIQNDTRDALKQGNAEALSTLRMLSASFHNRALEKRAKSGKEEEITDEEAQEVLRKESKKRKEAAELYRKGGRNDLAEKEEKEAAIIASYLPDEMSDVELKSAVERAVKLSGAEGPNDIGKAMGAAMREVAGRADGKRVQKIVKEILQ